MMELFIENQPVDVSSEFSTFITYQLDDIKDFGSRNTHVSKTIIIPGTNRNNQVFGNVYEVCSANSYNASSDNVLSNFNAAKSARCIVFQDQIQVLKGVIRLLKIVQHGDVIEYEVAVFGELGGLIPAIGNKKLEDLATSQTWNVGGDYLTDYTLTNIVNSWGLSSGDGIYYPLMDYGNYSTAKHNWDYKTFRPALFVRDYVTRILDETNYRYECDLFDTSRFRELIVPYNAATFSTLDDDISSLSNSSSQTRTPGSPLCVLPTMSTAAFTANGSNDQFTYTGTNSPGLRVRVRATLTSSNGDFSVDLIKYDSGGSPINSIGLAQSTNSIDETVDCGFGIATGEKLSLKIFFNGGTTATLGNIILDIASLVPVQVPLVLGNTFNIRDIIPKGISQLEFFKSIIRLFNLYVYEDANEDQKVIIKPYVDFYDLDHRNAIDWSGKLDRSSSFTTTPMSELSSRYYEFNFKSDSDYYNDAYQKKYGETYGSRIYDTQYEFAGNKKTVDIIFSGTPLVGYAGEDKVYSTIFKKTGSTEEQVNSNIRILQTKRITGVSSWSIKDGSTTLGSYTEYGYAGHLDDPDAPANDINFGVSKELFFTLAAGNLSVNQFNVYWSPYMAEITDKDSKLFQGKFYLTPKDIASLDFSKLIHLDGALWRLNKIDGYNVTRPETCQVTLLKVIDLVY